MIRKMLITFIILIFSLNLYASDFGVQFHFWSKSNLKITAEEIALIKSTVNEAYKIYNTKMVDKLGEKYQFNNYCEAIDIDKTRTGLCLTFCEYWDPTSMGIEDFDELYEFLEDDKKNGLIIFDFLKSKLGDKFEIDFYCDAW